MSSSLRRGALAATVIAFSIAPLAACGVGTDAQTLEVKPDNAATAVGDIKIQNATVVTQPKREAKGPAVITATLFNNGRSDQTLEAVTLSGSGRTAQLKPADGKGPLVVPAGGSVRLGGTGNAAAVLVSGREAVQDGNVQPVTFTFSKTGDVRLDTFVVPATSYFTEVGPSAAPSSSAPASPPASATSGSPSGSASGSASGAPGDGGADDGTDGTDGTQQDDSAGAGDTATATSTATGSAATG